MSRPASGTPDQHFPAWRSTVAPVCRRTGAVTCAGDQGRMAHAPKLTGCRVLTSRGDHPLSGVEFARADHAGARGSSATAEPAAVSSARKNSETGGLATTASRPTSSSCTQVSRYAELPAHGFAKDRRQVLSLEPDRMVARDRFTQFDDWCQLHQGADTRSASPATSVDASTWTSSSAGCSSSSQRTLYLESLSFISSSSSSPT
jgi:hypothetical protein